MENRETNEEEATRATGNEDQVCPECGERLYRQGRCYQCIACGWSLCGM